MTDIASLFNCSIVELQTRRQKGEFSYEELTAASFELIKRWEKEIHAFITVAEDSAIVRAKHADRVFSNDGVTHPLLGIPFTVKDTFCTKGIQTTAGSNILKEYVPPYTATAVQRVLDTGAILLGKTNCDSFGHGSSTENSDFGPTRNPWRGKQKGFDYVAGGSSGGSAAALAVGIGWFSIGEDTGGSIRQPAAFCGVCGLKPTYGRVSRYGSIAYASSLDTVGPMARSAIDVHTVFDTIAGPDENDATSVSEYNREERTVRSIGLPEEFFTDLPSSQKSVIEKAVNVMTELGFTIKKVHLPSTKYAISTYYLLATAETSSNLGRFDGIRYGGDRSRFSKETKRRILLGTYVLSAGYYDEYYALAQKVRTKIVQEYKDVFLECDVLLAPVSPIPPFKVGELRADPLQMYLADAFTVPVNVAGLPALALPAGFDANGLPVGMQIIGSQGSDEELFDIGKKYQELTDFHTRRPEKP